MDTILFLETIVRFHSYERYNFLHTGKGLDSLLCKIIVN
jgi:hypothetical protein